MTDVSFEYDKYAIRHSRPHDGISNPDTIRVYNCAPRRIALQIRYAKGFATANMTIEQVDSLIDTLIEARNETYPPIDPR
jgi:hypothetical protein